MPEPFKNAFNIELIEHMAKQFANNSKTFDQTKFIEIASENLTNLELKERSNQIIIAMQTCLPDKLSVCSATILNSLAPAKNETDDVLFSQDFNNEHQQNGIQGWAIMPVADFIGKQALKELEQATSENKLGIIETAMRLFKEVTQRFSAEFGIRFLLNTYPKETLTILKTWLNHPSQHVRRLISEGTRPRLPWGMQLPIFIKQPNVVIELLEALKDDKEEYVRRSVANNLNDIAKDHPDLIADITEKWLIGADKNRERLVRHACRTLLKNGHKKVLTSFGYKKPVLANISLKLSTSEVNLGDNFQIKLSLSNNTQTTQHLMIDYIIHHQKANGTTTPKVFKWSTKSLTNNKSLTLTKKHTIKPITTRKYYAGEHKVEVLINGETVAEAKFMLKI